MPLISKDYAFFTPMSSKFADDHCQTQRDYCRRPPQAWDFSNGDLILLQDDKGDSWWANRADLRKNDNDVALHQISFCSGQIQEIIRDRILCIMDTDTRLSDFRLLCIMNRATRPLLLNPRRTDFVATRLAGSQDVVIYTKLASGEKGVDKGATADYGRAKLDMQQDKKDTRNMRRFYDRYGPVGIGPSDLTKRVTHGKRTDREPISTSAISKDVESTPDTSPRWTIDQWSIHEEHPKSMGGFDPSVPKGRKNSILYRLLQLVRASPARLEAEQLRSERKRARLEKRPDSYENPSSSKAMQEDLDPEPKISHTSQE